MAYTGRRAAEHAGRRLSKFEYGRLAAASLAHLFVHQQDAAGLVTFDTAVRRYIPARSRVSHLTAILEELVDTEPGGETALAPIFHAIAEQIHRRGLVVIVSDLFDEPDDVLEALHHFRYRKHEVVVLHVMADEERTFPFDRWSEFRDLEVLPRRVQFDPRVVRGEYLERVQAFVRDLELGCGRMGVDYVPLVTRQPFDEALAHYLAHRRSRTR
jgi:uncharacterized protein (DUF58 family)